MHSYKLLILEIVLIDKYVKIYYFNTIKSVAYLCISAFIIGIDIGNTMTVCSNQFRIEITDKELEYFSLLGFAMTSC